MLTVTVTSNGLSDAQTFDIDVQAATGGVSVMASFIPHPFITSVAFVQGSFSCTVSRDAADASCRPPVAVGTVLSATVSFDPMPVDSGAVVSLTDDCGGSATNPAVDLAGGTATFDWTAPGSPASCLVTASITRETTLTDSQVVAIEIQ